MDGYIKNRKIELKSLQFTILCKYSPALFLALLFTATWLYCMNIATPPDEWKQEEIVFSHTSYETTSLLGGKSGNSKSFVLCTEDNRHFILPTRDKSAEKFENELVQGKKYTIVYSNVKSSIVWKRIEALYDENTVYMDRDDSESVWKENRSLMLVLIAVTLALCSVGLLFIDRLWCKKEHTRIKIVKEKISKRNERNAKRETV